MANRMTETRAWKISTGPIGFVLALGWLIWLGLTHLWPASYWLEVRDVHVHNAIEGEQILMSVDRLIVRDFIGRYYVQVRIVGEDDQTGHVLCLGDGGGPYIVGSDLPDPITLGWWVSNQDCGALPVGRYRVATTWRISPDFPLLPQKYLTVFSNSFEVLPREE